MKRRRESESATPGADDVAGKLSRRSQSKRPS